jgi:predicted RNA methylase
MAAQELAAGLQHLRAAEQLIAANRWAEAAAAYVVAIRSLVAGVEEQVVHDPQRRAARGLSFALQQLGAEAPIEARVAALSQALAALPPTARFARAVIHGDIGSWYCRAGRFPPAVAALRAAVALEPTAPSVLENLQHVLSSAVQRWHFRMLNDRRRNESYAAAIAAALSALPGSTSVLDIGTGTGLLAMLAARTGGPHCHVWACDCSTVMTALARECTAANGLSSQISVLDALSTHLSVQRRTSDIPVSIPGTTKDDAEADKVLPRRVDLVVTEILDAGLLGEHILPSLRHAREHLVAAAGRIIPRGATVFATCVSSADLRRRLYVSAESLALISRLLFPETGDSGTGAAAGHVDACLEGIRTAVGLDHGEHYDTVWLHRL